MTTVNPSILEAVRTALANRRSLTTDEKDALVEELTSDPEERGYATEIAAEAWEALAGKLHSDYNATVAAFTRDREFITQDEIVVLTSTLKAYRATQILASVTMSELDIYLIDVLMPSIASQKALSLTDPAGATLIPTLLSRNLITSEQAEALTKEPVEDAVEPRPSRASVLFGEDAIIEPSDLQSLRAESLI